MPISKVIWTSLTGTILIIISLLGAWMQSVDHSQSQAQDRLTLTEQHYAAIQQDLQDLREDMRDVKKTLQDGHNGR